MLSQWAALCGLAGVSSWNLAQPGWPGLPTLPWWGLLLAPLPGLLSWLAALTLPLALARANIRGKSLRLTWHTPPDWNDSRFRQALLNLIRVNSGIDLVWARDGYGLGCWLLIDDDEVLRRLVADVLPGGSLEEDPYPEPGPGVAVLQWRETPPTPAELCQRDGVTGVYFRWLSERGAVTAIWGDRAVEVGQQYARRASDLLTGNGAAVLRPPFTGDNPWPALPPFPPSALDAGLSSVSLLRRTAPALRIIGRAGLRLGLDPDRKPVGFDLPDLNALQAGLRLYGQIAAAFSLELAQQAVQAGLPVAFLDGSGSATGLLTRRLTREAANGRLLSCDVERPAQSRQRLNPLWLPPEQPERWPALLGDIWPAWLRELGVTPAGLGRTAFRHTRMAVMLTGLLAARRGLALDPAALLETLEIPDFLAQAETIGGPEIFGEELWRWWQSEGRHTHNFDVHLRLGHLRERLSSLLALPEYGILWRPPFTDPLQLAEQGLSLVWRLPDPRRRLRGYITSQLLALSALLSAWPACRPLLIVLYELDNIDAWVERLSRFPAARVVSAARRLGQRPLAGPLLLSKLERVDAERVQAEQAMGDIRATDLRRLPAQRLLLRRGKDIATIEIGG